MSLILLIALADHLYNSTWTQFLSSIQDVFMSRGFSEISEDVLAYILTSDNLKMDEARILEKVMEWINVNSVCN